jgi:hypothetical protein
MTDQQALEHIDQRMAEARDAAGQIATMRAIIDQTRAAFHEAGVLSGPLPERVRKLSADLRDVAADRDRYRAELDAIRAPAAPDVAPGCVEWRGRELFVGGRYEGLTGFVGNGKWMVAFGNRQIDGLPNESTARAVLLALADRPFGELTLTLRDGARIEDLTAASKAGLSSYVDGLLKEHVLGRSLGYPTTTTMPEIVRAWVAHGQAALTIEAVSS